MTSLDFAEAARRIGSTTRSAGHAAPAFRSPPRVRNCQRSIQHRRDGSATVAVAIKDRPLPGVMADMIDGVIAANDLGGQAASKLRDQLWTTVADLLAPEPTVTLTRGPDQAPAEVTPIRAA